jgi:hypothetical protein
MHNMVIELDDAERTRCEVWTRVMGYHRPVSSWNPGKRSEHAERTYFIEPCSAGEEGTSRSVHREDGAR